MIFGNLNEQSGTGVATSRDLQTYEKRVTGDYENKAQGMDVVSGAIIPHSIDLLRQQMPEVCDGLQQQVDLLEEYYGREQEAEFTVEDGTLWFSWSRVWEDIERQHRVLEGERLSTKRRLLASLGDGAKDFRHGDFRHAGGSRKSYVVWTARELGVLELMATENQDSKREEYGSDSTADRSSGYGEDDRVTQDHGGSEASNGG